MPTGTPRSGLAQLVEPLVTLADAVPEDVRDQDGVHKVALGSTAGGLASTCECERGATGLLCRHSLATAIETWHRAPERQG